MLLYPRLRLAAGWNNMAGYAAIEAITKVAPLVTPYVRPSVASRMANGAIRRDGFVDISWSWTILPASYLDSIVSTYLSNWTTDSAKVTIATFKKTTSGLTYANFNAWICLPSFQGEDDFGGFDQRTTIKLTEVKILFSRLIEI